MKREDIFSYVQTHYDTQPEYLFSTAPTYAVLRHKSGKWYAVIMDVAKKTLGLEGEGTADIVNVKCDPVMVGSLRLQEGYLPAYHMNKDKWISIVLDSSVPEDDAYALISSSYELTMTKAKRKK